MGGLGPFRNRHVVEVARRIERVHFGSDVGTGAGEGEREWMVDNMELSSWGRGMLA